MSLPRNLHSFWQIVPNIIPSSQLCCLFTVWYCWSRYISRDIGIIDPVSTNAPHSMSFLHNYILLYVVKNCSSIVKGVTTFWNIIFLKALCWIKSTKSSLSGRLSPNNDNGVLILRSMLWCICVQYYEVLIISDFLNDVIFFVSDNGALRIPKFFCIKLWLILLSLQ
jgi:hypothetical protein